MLLKRKANGAPLSATTQASRITPIRKWFRWLVRQNRILYNPAADLDLPKVEERLPKHVLTIEEVERVLAQPDLTTPLGVRDRAMLEVLYSTGMRRMEIIGLQQRGVDDERGTLLIRQGKGKKDRMVPIGDRALAWLAKYRDEVRPELAPAGDDDTLFLTVSGQAFSDNRMTQMVRVYVRAAGLGNIGSCHLFRHAMATQMLENGADVRFIQAMLGHADIKTTQVYTRVSIRALKDIHTATHPDHWHAAGAGPRAGNRYLGSDRRIEQLPGQARARVEIAATGRTDQPTAAIQAEARLRLARHRSRASSALIAARQRLFAPRRLRHRGWGNFFSFYLSIQLSPHSPGDSLRPANTT
ncbi:MAG: site-specific tyrosine recombinase XerC [Cupriavidus sp.]|nr:site-specific tyrosine recombinase XerC [Cupriavidus sp.]